MSTKSNIVNYTLDTSKTAIVGVDMLHAYGDPPQNTMYYTTSTGVINTIDISNKITLDPNHNITMDASTWDTYSSWFKNLKEFEDTMPDLIKIKEMCIMYPALDKAFENFRAVYDLVKDDYEARKNNDS